MVPGDCHGPKGPRNDSGSSQYPIFRPFLDIIRPLWYIEIKNTDHFGGNSLKKGNPIALLPIGIFLLIYLGLGLLFEYGMHIPMGFYNVPIVIAFLVAIVVACLQNRKLRFN